MNSPLSVRRVSAAVALMLSAVMLCVSCTVPTKGSNNNSENDMSQDSTTTVGDVIATIHTTKGDVTVQLFGDTPKHQANFVRLAEEGYYDGLLFHRVIRDFMVQTGDPDSRDAQPGAHLGSGGPGWQIDAEIICPGHFHRRGALAAARQGDNVNPERKSSGSQFYIVTGKKFSEAQLGQLARSLQQQGIQSAFDSLVGTHRAEIMELRRQRDQAGLQVLQEKLIAEATAMAEKNGPVMTDEMKEAYLNEGGAPHLDGSYTVFGQVISGMEVVEAIQEAETDSADRPKEDVRITSVTIDRR